MKSYAIRMKLQAQRKLMSINLQAGRVQRQMSTLQRQIKNQQRYQNSYMQTGYTQKMGQLQSALQSSLLMKDFLNLYYFSKNMLEKLSSFDKGDVMINSIVSQVVKNITLLRTKLYDYIVNSFSDKYIHNLYQYNFFIQGLNINIEMLKKIKDFNPN